jgi:hypothetical protein
MTVKAETAGVVTILCKSQFATEDFLRNDIAVGAPTSSVVGKPEIFNRNKLFSGHNHQVVARTM